MRDDDRCPHCGTLLSFLAGKPAHDRNRYCPDENCGYEAWNTPTPPKAQCVACEGRGYDPNYNRVFQMFTRDKIYCQCSSCGGVWWAEEPVGPYCTHCGEGGQNA